MQFVTIRVISVFVAIVACAISYSFSNAQESPPLEKELTSLSPDKKWEYKLDDGSFPGIVKAGTTQIVVNLDQELAVSSRDADRATVTWAPDSKRFAFNYSPTHPSNAPRYETVAFYQLRGDKWIALRAPADDNRRLATSQFVQLAKDYLPGNLHLRGDDLIPDIFNVPSWTDSDTAILHTWYGRKSSRLEAGLVFTLKFDAQGNWKIIKTRRMSEKEAEKREKEQ
jgi:hypothetical protein